MVLPVARPAGAVPPPPPWPGVPDRSDTGASGPSGADRPGATSTGGRQPGEGAAPPGGAGADLPAADRPGTGEERGATRVTPAATAAATDRIAVLRAALARLRLTPRRVALVVTALGVAAATGIGTAFAIVGNGSNGSPTAAPVSGSTPDGPPDAPYGRRPDRPPPDGDRPVGPPPFPCLRPNPIGEPIVARPGTADGGFRPPAGWTWHVEEGWRVAVPVGWLRFTENEVACFRDPSSLRTLSVEPVADHLDPVAWLRAEEHRLRDAGALPGYAKVRLGATGDRGAQWECRWTAPFGQRQQALRLLPGDEAGAWMLGWSAADDDWAASTGQLAVVRQSFRGRVTEAVSPT
ncbi:hypothetical protein [Micromonospora sp. CPCC 205714]|uniref:hypothetical protein n=1 Tax=Micromonospora sp. CPCC 205714 TaxID=3122402 RepID=UPI002FF10F16